MPLNAEGLAPPHMWAGGTRRKPSISKHLKCVTHLNQRDHKEEGKRPLIRMVRMEGGVVRRKRERKMLIKCSYNPTHT